MVNIENAKNQNVYRQHQSNIFVIISSKYIQFFFYFVRNSYSICVWWLWLYDRILVWYEQCAIFSVLTSTDVNERKGNISTVDVSQYVFCSNDKKKIYSKSTEILSHTYIIISCIMRDSDFFFVCAPSTTNNKKCTRQKRFRPEINFLTRNRSFISK